MYLQPAFAEDRLEVRHGLMRAYPLATLIVADADGITADLIPFMLYADEGSSGLGVLRAHVARANPLWRRLEAGAQCLVQFQGPDAYISPSWYETKRTTHKVVPTWDYAMVQARGAARVVDEPFWLRRLLDHLTAAHEGGLPQPWELDDAPADFMAATMKAIIGIEIPIDSLVGKWKVSQNRNAADQRGVVAGLQQHPMAQLVAERLKPD
ncbi:FMN-binding negative transcriptional regulator [Duganella sp. HH101]|uniref:FMN-binding negative transcriptional regulator n=1 Tax=Duganella sp. HH101 TaxID=1781066 RepID=UPI0008744C92|nr:FMN-binding negative transcriptional regulator [Duganella sp. HH101]OFA00125.1 protease synthase and sporulation protein PAI 2 [Duganella sp. HH101]